MPASGQVYGERKVVPDNYQELNVDVKHSSGELLRLTFRAYNEGAALRYQYLPHNGHDFELTAEKTEFHLPPNTWGYEEHASEGEYQRARVNDIKQQCERPLTLELEAGLFACVAEADNERYPRMLLRPLPAH